MINYLNKTLFLQKGINTPSAVTKTFHIWKKVVKKSGMTLRFYINSPNSL